MKQPVYNSIENERTEVKEYQFALIRQRFSVISELLDNEEVTNILINRFDNIYYDTNKGRYKFDGKFKSERDLRSAVYSIANSKKLKFDNQNSILHANLPDGSRLQATTIPTNLDGTSVNIRLFRKCRMTLDDLYERNLFGFDEQKAKIILNYLKKSVEEKHNFLIAGSTNTGKTTLMNAMLKWIPDEKDHILTIEDVSELQTESILNTRLYTGDSIRTDNENLSYFPMKNLIETSLRATADRIFVGELRQPQAGNAFYEALNSGHQGVGATIHSFNAESALDRLASFVVEKKSINYEYVLKQLRVYMQTVIYINSGHIIDQNGERYFHREITQIIEIEDNGNINMII